MAQGRPYASGRHRRWCFLFQNLLISGVFEPTVATVATSILMVATKVATAIWVICDENTSIWP